jgi:PD-(D/E)XK endonuclease
MNPRKQGDLGELSAMEWLASQGAHIYVPVGHSPDVDLIADFGDRILRVEVKTSTCRRESGRWYIHISTLGGNQSWSGLVKYFDPARCDYLFVLVGDGRRWFVPTSALEGRSAITLGGPKYSEFEVEPGKPPVARPLLESNSGPGEYPSGQRTAAVNRQAMPSQVRILPPPLPENASARTRISKHHQITIPTGPFHGAGLRSGDPIRVQSVGDGRLTLSRIDGALPNPALADGHPNSRDV